jgi:hypothetical protein
MIIEIGKASSVTKGSVGPNRENPAINCTPGQAGKSQVQAGNGACTL